MTQFDSTPSSSRKSKIFKIGLPITIVIAGVLIMSIMTGLATKPEKKDIEKKAPLVNAIEVQAQDLTFQISSQGTVMPRTETVLVSEVSGQITYVSPKLRVGGYFEKDELILEVDPITYKVDVLQAESRLESMQAAYIEEEARAQQAEDEWGLTGRPVSEAPVLALRLPQLQKAKADVKAAEADLKQANIKLERTKIYAPYNALLMEKYVDIGQYISTGSQMVKTFAIDYAEVRLPIKQSDIGFLNLPKINEEADKSKKVIISSEVAGEKLQWQSYISRYEGVVSSESRVHYLVAKIDDPYNLIEGKLDAELRVGMFVNANIMGKTIDNIVSLPREVIHGVNTVYVVNDDNTLKFIEVEVIRGNGDFVYVKNTFKPGDKIVNTAIRTAVPGMAVRIKADEIVEQSANVSAVQ
ncbi:efflux RND transporter periplasmic adaptor subunit [Thalassotalea crassostreae]|uniref:efflux RND transporter periplasmic adaptor subunit n=1 Tax=Thalassotalea crassostreae TaxID=1763536 RepID=UPI0008398762|nr:efflux RND transporter periplasmic adaptor subunit [Thalassotalea crassostreae]